MNAHECSWLDGWDVLLGYLSCWCGGTRPIFRVIVYIYGHVLRDDCVWIVSYEFRQQKWGFAGLCHNSWWRARFIMRAQLKGPRLGRVIYFESRIWRLYEHRISCIHSNPARAIPLIFNTPIWSQDVFHSPRSTMVSRGCSNRGMGLLDHFFAAAWFGVKVCVCFCNKFQLQHHVGTLYLINQSTGVR